MNGDALISCKLVAVGEISCTVNQTQRRKSENLRNR